MARLRTLPGFAARVRAGTGPTRMNRSRDMQPTTSVSSADTAPLRRPMPRPGVMEIAPYVPGRTKSTGGGKLFKLSSNETPLGASPAAIEAYRGEAAHLELYPDGGSVMLREAIADVHGLNADRIICGNGSDEILELVARAYIGPGDEARLQRIRLSGLQDRDPCRWRDPRCRRREGHDHGCRRDARMRHRQDQGRLPRQPEQSHGHLSAL